MAFHAFIERIKKALGRFYPKHFKRVTICAAVFALAVASGKLAMLPKDVSISFVNSDASAIIARQPDKEKESIRKLSALPFFAGPIGRNNSAVGGTTSGLPKFTYTGTYTLIYDGDKNWRIKFLDSGTFTPLQNMTVDVFGVGGGQAGSAAAGSNGGKGGNGGQTVTVRSVVLIANTTYTVVIGAGGLSSAGNGGDSSFAAICIASGGKIGTTLNTGSGGGIGSNKAYAGKGGSNGGNGNGYSLTVANGTDGTGISGQGTTTAEFGESGNDLYSFGGGGGSYTSGAKGDGGRGNNSGDGGFNANGSPGFANTGDGGGGAGFNSGGSGGSGGSGIVIIRNARAAA